MLISPGSIISLNGPTGGVGAVLSDLKYAAYSFKIREFLKRSSKYDGVQKILVCISFSHLSCNAKALTQGSQVEDSSFQVSRRHCLLLKHEASNTWKIIDQVTYSKSLLSHGCAHAYYFTLIAAYVEAHKLLSKQYL